MTHTCDSPLLVYKTVSIRRQCLSVTILTPFSNSPMTDASVNALPTLFLAYYALDYANQPLAD